MKCQCICNCKEDACEDPNRIPELCIACNLCDALGSARHGLPYVAPVYKPLEPLAPVTDQQKDAAIQEWVAENGF